MDVFNAEEWQKKISDPQWYMAVPGLLKQMYALHDTDRVAYENTKEQIYSFFEQALKDGTIALSTTGKNFDAERKPIDTVVIHHTSIEAGITKDRISAIDLVRLYAPQYADPSSVADKDIRGDAVYSGHFRDGKQVFWPYHWIIRAGGVCERLLNDEEIGWQAGNWDVNCRSVGIVFDNDYEHSIPADEELRTLAKLIREKYPQVKRENIIGHCEVNKKTCCPSHLFLSKDGKVGWKEKLINMI